MRYLPKCKKCGCIMLQRNLKRIDADWARNSVVVVERVSGSTTQVFERLCPKCNPRMVVAFQNGEQVSRASEEANELEAK